MKWEYNLFSLRIGGFFATDDLDAAGLNQKLNLMGNEGWELVSVFDTHVDHGRTRDVLVVFKRPKS
jgi:hypothetical protein